MGLGEVDGGVLVGWALCKRVTEGWIEVGDLVQTGDQTLALFLSVKTPSVIS